MTGSGRVAHGILEVMNLMGVIEVEPDEYLERKFTYPIFTQLKGAALYANKITGKYNRDEFHHHPEKYQCQFSPYATETDILMNGIYWDQGMPRLFEWEDLTRSDFSIQTIADITDDKNGSIPCNLGDQTIEDPIYGVDKLNRQKTKPYIPGSVDVMAVGNLPNELPRDASRYFGEQLIKHVLQPLVQNSSPEIEKATIVKKGLLTADFEYLKEYAGQL